jgi:hypothetical protein
MRVVEDSLATPPNSLRPRLSFHMRKIECPRFSLTREPLSHRLGLRAFLFEDFPLRLKPVIKGTLADALFVDPVGAH